MVVFIVNGDDAHTNRRTAVGRYEGSEERVTTRYDALARNDGVRR